MADKKTKQTRRKVLKSAAIGAGAAGASYSGSKKWTKPIINSVFTPVHAQMSVGDTTGGGTGKITSSRDVMNELDYEIS